MSSECPASRHRHCWRSLLVSAIISSVVLVPVGVHAKSRPSREADRDYIYALAAANTFLHAWQTHDSETGLLMLTDGAKRHTTEEKLQTLFAPNALTPQAFLISSGKKLKPGRYVFDIYLLRTLPENETVRRHFSRIVVIRAGKQDWAVDNIP